MSTEISRLLVVGIIAIYFASLLIMFGLSDETTQTKQH